MEEYGLYINGKWEKPAAAKIFATINPADGETLASFPMGTQEDVARAVGSAMNAFAKWKRVSPPKRGEILLKAAAIMRARKEELGAMVTREMGKVIAEGKGDVQEAIDFHIPAEHGVTRCRERHFRM